MITQQPYVALYHDRLFQRRPETGPAAAFPIGPWGRSRLFTTKRIGGMLVPPCTPAFQTLFDPSPPQDKAHRRFRVAQQALGHNSKAVHYAYAKHAEVTVPSLDDWEESYRRR